MNGNWNAGKLDRDQTRHFKTLQFLNNIDVLQETPNRAIMYFLQVDGGRR